MKSSGRAIGLLRIGMLIAVALGLGADRPAEPPQPLRIGLVQSLFRDVPPPLVEMLAQPFRSLMHAQTGLRGQLYTIPDWQELSRQLHEDKLHLGVFHGVEFAWAREQYADLKPLCIAINQQRELYAYVVVRQDQNWKDFADLKGTTLAVPLRTREHCRLFLERLCRTSGQTPAQFFARCTRPLTVETALDDVLRGKVQAALVDSVSLRCYEQVKPGCYARLRPLAKSERFPAAVIVYRQGTLSAATLDRLKNGLLTAHQNERSRELMHLWKLTAFETLPAGYEQDLDNILKSYPAADYTSLMSPTSAVAP